MSIGSGSSTIGSTGIPFSQTGTLTANQVLVFDTVTQAFVNSILPDGGNTGEINTGSNVGSGTGVFKDKLLGDLRFKTVVGGSGINISSNTNELTIATTGSGTGDITNGENTGSGSNVFRDKNGANLRFRSLTAGTNVTIIQNVDDITIAASTDATTLNGLADTAFVKVANNLSDVTAADARTNLAISSTAETDAKYIHLDTSKSPTADATTSLGTGVKRFNKIYAVAFKGNADTATSATNLVGFSPGDYVTLAGSTMTGALTLSGAPTADLHAATKLYVDAGIANAIDTAPALLNTLNELAAALGDDANFSTTVTNSIATKLALVGGTLTGTLVLAGAPTADLHAATKLYVDGQDALQLTAASNLSDVANAATVRTNLGLGTAATTAATAYLAAGTLTTGVAEGSNLYYTDARWDTRLLAKTTADLAEGSNLYYTNARADARITAADTGNLSEGSNLYYTNARADARVDVGFAAKSTTNLTEGTNLYFTTARADAQIAAASVGDISNVDLTGITNGQFLKWDGGNSKFIASNVLEENLVDNDTDDLAEGSTNLYFTAARAKAATVADAINNGTVDIAPSQNAVFDALALKEGTITAGSSLQYYRGDKSFRTLDTSVVVENTNLYYTDARFDTRLAAKTTANLAEGANLYYTDARADARADVRIAASDTGDLSEGSNLYFTNARVDTRLAAKSVGVLSDVDLTGIANGQFLKWNGVKFIAQSVTQEDLSNNTTDDIAEGSTNLYYTDARANARVAAATGANLDLSSKTTANLIEVTNLYYTQARFDSALTAKSTTNLSEGTNLYYTDARADARITAADTGDLSEGSNLYYTNARADARIGAASVGDISNVDLTGITNGQFLKWDAATTKFVAASVTEENLTNNTTSDLAEGTNLYYTNARADARVDAGFAAKSTTNLSEGTNLYYTDARADARADARIGASSAGALTDVNLVGITTGQFLKWNGTTLVPSNITEENLSNNTTSDLAEGTNLYYTNARADARVTAAVGASVQAYDADLTAIGALAKADGNIIVGDGSTWVAESGATARTSLGLGTMAAAATTTYYDKTETDGRFANVLGVGANLADIADAASARTNLGLGSAATLNSTAFADITLSNLSNYAGARANLGAMSIAEGDARFVNIDESWQPAVDDTITLGNSTKRFNTIYARQIIGKFVGEFGAGVNTDALTEGSLNLYYTDARFDTRLAAKTTANLAEGANLYYTDARADARFDTRLAAKTTANLAEGANLYYTDARADARIGASSIGAMSDINLTTPATANQGLMWDAGTSKFIPSIVMYPGGIFQSSTPGTSLLELRASASNEKPEFIRILSSDIIAGSIALHAEKATDMADGFGSGASIYIKDNSGGKNYIGGYYAKRAGSDNTGALCMYASNAGTASVVLEISPTGAATFAGAFTLPITDGTAGQVLSTNGSGVVGWSTVSGGSGGDITAVNAGAGLTGGGLSGDVTLAVDVGTTAGKIVQLDGSAKLPAVDGSQLTNIAHTPAGYNNANWDTAFGWGNHGAAGYITATLTDEQVQDKVGAMLSSNTETLITATYQDSDGTIDLVVDNNLANYSNATSGFLTSETSHADVVVDGDFASQGIMLRGAGAGTYSILTDSSANWNTAFGWGNHASGGYLTSIAANSINDTHIDWGTGSNQVSTADIPEATNLYYTDVRADARITNAGSANWNTAYGWGNHASGGYLTSTGVLSSHTDVHNAAPADGQVLTWVNANSRWEAAAGSGGIALTDLSVGSEGSASGDGSIAYNNGTGVFTYTPPTASGIGAGTMSNVVEDTSPQLGGYLDAQTNKITNVGKLQLVDGLDDSVLEIDVGYARQSTWALTGSTSGTTPTEIFVGGTASRRVLPADYNDVAMFEISVVAVDTNTLANSAAWKFIGFGFNNAGTLALIGNITEEEINAQTGWSVVIGVTSTDLTITVTADAGSAVKWAAFAKCTQAQSS